MRYLWQHIRTVTSAYDGRVPLTHFLKEYCRKYPILGSRDRKMLGTIVYSWYRCAKGIKYTTKTGVDSPDMFENTVRQCLELCHVYTPQYERLFAGVEIPSIPHSFDPLALFPYGLPLSAGIETNEWLASMLVQPQLFIRIRKGRDKILSLFAEKDIPYTSISPTCLSLPNGAPVDTLLPPDSYVVQDASSQHTGDFFKPQSGERWYDCCSGAGGKSLLLMDTGIPVQLTVSDRRASIISNLKERFRQYGHKLPAAFIADAADAQQIDKLAGGIPFHNIICDAPCSGSGTWARTPEQLYFFNPASIARFSELQTSIAINVSRQLRQGGRLIYITCSVFRQENEDVVQEITRATGLRLAHQELINGIGLRADSMFVAVLQQP